MALEKMEGEHRQRDGIPTGLLLHGWGSARGATAVEFAILAPIFVGLLIAIIGIGLDGFYQLALDDAVRDAARQVQIGGPASRGGSGFAAAVCNEFGIIATGCTGNLTYTVQTNTPPANFAALTPVNVSVNGQLANIFPTIAGGNNVLVQAAYPLPLKLPIVGTAITFTGTNSILATTTIRMEPAD